MRCWLIVTTLCAAAFPLAAQQPTFSLKREVVRVDVLVTDSRGPVRGLIASDFEILDSGVPQQIGLASFEQVPLTIALVLDASASITPERLDNLRDGGHAILENMKSDDQVALLTFDDAVVLRERLSADTMRVRAALGRMVSSHDSFSGTALIDASYAAMTVLDADPGRALLVAFTDGVDTSSWLRADRVLQTARRSNAVVYGVSTTPLARGSFLRELSNVTGGEAIEIRSTAQLRATFVRILEEFRQRYLVSFSPSNVPADGWHPLTVRVKNRKVAVSARAGYTR
jgi:VWFA-related protein